MNGDMTYTLIMIIILIAVFYLFMIRPESKRKKQQEEMRSNLRKGDQITTIGGVVGRVVKIEDNTIIIETSEDRVRMEFAKWAVSTVGVQRLRRPRGGLESGAVGAGRCGPHSVGRYGRLLPPPRSVRRSPARMYRCAG